MLKSLLIPLSFVVVTTCFAQQPVKEYKALTDKAIKKSFSRTGFKKVKCDTYIVQETDKMQLHHGYFKDDKNRKVNIELITIIYYLYSKELNYEFSFFISVDSNLEVDTEAGGFNDIPPCVRIKGPCNYIKKEAAIEIAQKDSIQYPDNLLAEMRKPKKSSEFYWVVSGQDRRNVDYSVKPEEGWNIYPKKKRNTRYVNTITGKILSYEDYEFLDK